MRRPARLIVLAAAALLIILIVGRAASVLFTEILWFAELDHLGVLLARIQTIAVLRVATAIVGAAVVWVNLWRVARHLGPDNAPYRLCYSAVVYRPRARFGIAPREIIQAGAELIGAGGRRADLELLGLAAACMVRRRYGNLEIAEQVPRRYVHVGMAVASVFAGWWLSELMFPVAAASELRAWMHAEPWGLADPVFGRDISFYVFSLPVYVQLLDFLLLVSIWALVLTIVGYVLVGAVRLRDSRLEIDETPRLHFAMLVAGIVLLVGARYWLARYGVLLEGTGFSGIVGYTDLHARLPAQRVLAALSLAVAGALVYGAWRRQWWPPVAAVGLLAVASITLGYIYPSIVQQLQVEPNQLDRESPYIRRNIEFTRLGWGLEDITDRFFLYEQRRVPSWDALEEDLDRLPLWDMEPLLAAITQTQTRTGYYHFPGIRLDRYGPPGREEPVAIAVREFTREGLPAASRTWRNLHLNPRTVRGLGAVVVPVAQKTTRGDPVLWLREIEPVQRSPAAPAALELERPSRLPGHRLGSTRLAAGPRSGCAADLVPAHARVRLAVRRPEPAVRRRAELVQPAAHAPQHRGTAARHRAVHHVGSPAASGRRRWPHRVARRWLHDDRDVPAFGRGAARGGRFRRPLRAQQRQGDRGRALRRRGAVRASG